MLYIAWHILGLKCHPLCPLRVNTVLEDKSMKDPFYIGSWHIFLPSEVLLGNGWAAGYCMQEGLCVCVCVLGGSWSLGFAQAQGLGASITMTRSCSLSVSWVHLELLDWNVWKVNSFSKDQHTSTYCSVLFYFFVRQISAVRPLMSFGSIRNIPNGFKTTLSYKTQLPG